MDKQTFIDIVEMGLSYADSSKRVEEMDACRRFLRLFGAPVYAVIDPDHFAREHWNNLATQQCTLFAEHTEECVADPETLQFCLSALLRSAVLKADSGLAVELFNLEERGEQIPCIALGLDGPGGFSEEANIGDMFFLTREELGACWTLATRGGRIDPAPNGFLLRLKGIRMSPEIIPEADQLLTLLTTNDNMDLTAALAFVDGPLRENPGDFAALLREVWEEKEPILALSGIHTELSIMPGLPPISMRRGRLRALLIALMEFVRRAVPPESHFSMTASYDAQSRRILLSAALRATNGSIRESFHFAGMKRATAEHQGTFEFTCDDNEALLDIAVPDPVGRILDEWVPQWHRFTAKSQQVLRLLKSGAPLPQPELFLQGVLEEELERWFYPRLSEPIARNIAHELTEAGTPLPGAHPERRKKVLAQLARGKPKRELCHPPELGELVWAFCTGERGRAALGLELITAEDIELFCRALLAQPPGYVDALRITAKLFT